MPAPYRTNCRNYKESGFSSRDHCRHQCLRSELMTRFNYLTLNVKLYENDNTSLLMPNSTREFWKSQVSDFFDAGTFVEVMFQNLCEKNVPNRTVNRFMSSTTLVTQKALGPKF